MTKNENLYYENIVPANKRGSEYSNLLNLASWNKEKLSATLQKNRKFCLKSTKTAALKCTALQKLKLLCQG